MTFDFFLWYGKTRVPVAVAILEDCCMAFANMQVNELWPMGLLFFFFFFFFFCFLFFYFVLFCFSTEKY